MLSFNSRAQLSCKAGPGAAAWSSARALSNMGCSPAMSNVQPGSEGKRLRMMQAFEISVHEASDNHKTRSMHVVSVLICMC